MKTMVFIVKVKTVDTVNISQMARYIREAVGAWGGQLHPDDPLFEQKKISVRPIKDGRKEID